MRSNEYLFSEMPVRRAVLSLAVPTVISQIITVIYNMADTFFIAQLNDPNQVAAATVAMPAFIALTALSNLFGICGAGKIARCLGKRMKMGLRKQRLSSYGRPLQLRFYTALLYFYSVRDFSGFWEQTRRPMISAQVTFSGRLLWVRFRRCSTRRWLT